MKDYDEQFSPSQDEIDDQMPEPSEEGFQADGRWGYLRDEEYVEVVLHNQLPLYGRGDDEMMTYSNPRMSATIENWPSGSKRVTARFEIEQDTRKGERAVRVTDGAPKKLTFAKMMRIVDGSDGRTYIAAYTMYGHVSIFKGDMKFSQEAIFPGDPRYSMVVELFA